MKTHLFVFIFIILIFAAQAFSQIPRIINYQGIIMNTDEGHIPEGEYKVTFKLYDEPGKVYWTEVHEKVFISGGMIHVHLGTIQPLDIDFDRAYFLGVQIGNDPELQPRMLLTAAPYSFVSEDAKHAGGFPISPTPQPEHLLPLDGQGKFPSSVLAGSTGGDCSNCIRKNAPDTSRANSSAPMILFANQGNGDGINGRSINGRGMVGRSDNNDGVVGWSNHEKKSGIFGHTDHLDGYAVYGLNHGTSSYGYLGGDHGVKGWSKGVYDAGHFEATGGLNHAVYAKTTGGNSFGGFFVATANYSYGLYAEGPATNLNGCAALFKGNIEIKSRDTDDTVLELGEGLDYAEGFDISNPEEVEPGMVLCIDPQHPGKLSLSAQSYDKKVAGIAAGANGLKSGVRLGPEKFDLDVALAGRVYCFVDASFGAVSPGDLLTTSPTPGYAMKVSDYTQAQGAILGKAMQSLSPGEKGQILVLVTLQ